MRTAFATTLLVLAMSSAPVLAQPATPADSSTNTPAVPATPTEPAALVVAADSAAASSLPPTTRTTVSNALPPPPAAALNKTYPVCTRTRRDNCQNPGEGGAPGRGKASNNHLGHHSG